MNGMRLVTALFFVILQVSAAGAATVFSNITNAQRFAISTGLYWDDARILGGGQLTRFRFYANNAQSGARIYDANITIHLFDEAKGIPNGVALGSFRMQSSTPLSGGMSRLLESPDLQPLNIYLPTNARLGVAFDFGSNFGALMHHPPTIGTSENALWSGDPPIPLPTSSAVGNIGFELEVVPEPTACVLFATIGLALGVSRWRRSGHTSGLNRSERLRRKP